ncbi:MAG: 2-amino-4-hydroxy-6-hydroxymethyldihydropteridine diphosphokinase [Pelagibacteraceae bacterium]
MKILALGSNLPYKNHSPENIINLAYEFLLKKKIKILKKSHIYLSEAYPNKNDPKFCNSVISIETDLKPIDLLDKILEVEKEFGRVREIKNSPRTLDIDIICYNDLIINEKEITIPHPSLHKRAFVLLPLRDIDENWRHPVHLKTILQFIKEFNTNELNKVKKII